MPKLERGNWKVVRNCCQENCGLQRHPYGKPLRIIQMENLSEASARMVAKNWATYEAEAVEQQPATIEIELKAVRAVADYLGFEGTNWTATDFSAVRDWEHPDQPVAVRFDGPDEAQDFLVHAPYTLDTVAEVEFKTWPPTARR